MGLALPSASSQSQATSLLLAVASISPSSGLAVPPADDCSTWV